MLADYLLGRHGRLSESLFHQRERMYRSATRISMLSGFVSGTTLALAYQNLGAAGELNVDALAGDDELRYLGTTLNDQFIVDAAGSVSRKKTPCT